MGDTIIKFCLYEGRHQLPTNEGALFSSFNFEKFQPVPSEKYTEALELVKKGEEVGIYVTGMTPALTYFLSQVKEYKGKVTLFHYNAQTGEYVEQVF